jgi:membrane protease YdiL (CAAX protease family)
VLLGFSAIGLSPVWYVPVNLVATVALLAMAGRLGLTRREVGLSGDGVGEGIRLGLLAAVVVAGILVVGAALPLTRPMFDDARTTGIGAGLLAYRALIRIPFGTVLLEEVAFRGVLLAAWRRVADTRWAAVGSSAVFGLWHVRPAIDLLIENDIAAGGAARSLAVAGAVVGTTAAGLVFCWLRIKSGSLVAPLIAHAAANSLATLVAFVV